MGRTKSSFEPSKDLRKNILATIVKEEIRRARNYLLASATAVLVSIVGLIFSVRYVAQAVYQSNFYQYVSLVVSDSDVVFLHWKEFVLSILEAAPFFAITLTLITIVAFMASVRACANSARIKGHADRTPWFSFNN